MNWPMTMHSVKTMARMRLVTDNPFAQPFVPRDKKHAIPAKITPMIGNRHVIKLRIAMTFAAGEALYRMELVSISTDRCPRSVMGMDSTSFWPQVLQVSQVFRRRRIGMKKKSFATSVDSKDEAGTFSMPHAGQLIWTSGPCCCSVTVVNWIIIFCLFRFNNLMKNYVDSDSTTIYNRKYTIYNQYTSSPNTCFFNSLSNVFASPASLSNRDQNRLPWFFSLVCTSSCSIT